MNLKKNLKNRLGGSKKTAILGVGSDLRADDAAGLLAAGALKNKFPAAKLRVFLGGTAPENLTGEIKKFKPDHVVIIDSADSGARPGTVVIIEPEKIAGTSFSTHQLPAKILVDYLHESTGCMVTIIGIQPKSITFGEALSKAVNTAVEKTAAALEESLKHLKR